MNTQKGFIVPLIILIAVILVGGAAYYGIKEKAPSSSAASSSVPTDVGQSIEAMIDGMLTDSHKVRATSDAIALAKTYYTSQAAAHFRSMAATAASGSSGEIALVQGLQSLPHPSDLVLLSTVVASSTAVVTYQLKGISQIQPKGTAPQKPPQGLLTVNLEKDEGNWLISTMAISFK